MKEQWQELKETIIEIRDNNKFNEDISVMCKFLINYMGVLEEQIQEPCEYAPFTIDELKDKDTQKLFRKFKQEPILEKIKAEIEKQEKWLLQAGYNQYNVDIAFSIIESLLAGSEV